MSRAHHYVTTRSGLTIGCAYTPPPPRPGSEAEQIQAALLHTPPPLAERLLDAFDHHSPAIIVSIAISGLAYGLLRMALS